MTELLHRRFTTLLTAAALLLLAGTVAVAAQGRSAYGPQGELVRVEAGTFDELIGSGGANKASTVGNQDPILTLSISRLNEDGAPFVQRMLVPGTDNGDLESPLSLMVDPATGNVHLIFARHQRGALRELRLAAWVDGEWQPTVEISGNPGVAKSWPSVSVTRDDNSDGAPRTVTHLLWWEAKGAGEEILYTPVVVENGRFLGWNPILPLQGFGIDEEAEGARGTGPLYRAPSLEAGTRGHTTIAAIPQRSHSQIATMRIRLLPSMLTRLASDVRGHITLVGAQGGGGGVLNLAEKVRGHITLVGARIHDGVLDYITEQSVMEILSHGPQFDNGDLEAIGRSVADRIVDAGASIIDSELQNASATCGLLALGATPEDGPVNSNQPPLHQLEICALSVRRAPDIEAGMSPRLYTSEDGSKSLVAWQNSQGDLRYRLSSGVDDWGPARQAVIDDLGVSTALLVLRKAVRP